MKRFVAVAGTIGAGKSSLVAWLHKHYGLEPFYEPHEKNPFLEDFYGDMSRWAFHSQLFFFAHKLELHQAMEHHAGDVVLDRTLYEDAEVFAKNLANQRLMSAREWKVYERLYLAARRSLRPPDVLVALTCPLSTTMKRIARRGRSMEAAIPRAYLARLHRLYAAWYKRYDLSPIVVIDTGKLDYVENLVDQIEVRHAIEAALR